MTGHDENRQADVAERITQICDAFEEGWAAGEPDRIEDCVEQLPEVHRATLLRELLLIELRWRRKRHETPSTDDYTVLFPEHAALIEECIRSSDVGDTANLVDGSARSTLTPGADESKSPGDSKTPAFQSGTCVADYELLQELGRGGMGVVYKARQIGLKRIVALKMIRAGRLADEDEVRRFQVEAETAARLDHPNIVPIFDVGEHNGEYFFSMAYVEGQSLSERLAEQPVSHREAATLIKAVAEAVAYAHTRNVVHRDLKPANILLDANDQPRVTDFGLAKRMDVEHSLTPNGQVMGTAHYMAPEQAQGKSAEVGTSADIYALGGILYRLLTGRATVDAANVMEILDQIVHKEPPSARRIEPSVDRDLETICMKCLQKDPKRRYETARELADELDRYLGGFPIRARRTSRVERVWRWVRRRPAIAAISSLSVVAIAMLLILYQKQMLDSEKMQRMSDEVQKQLDRPLYEWDGDRLRATAAAVDDLRSFDEQLAEEEWSRVIAKFELDLIGGPPIRSVSEFQRMEGLLQELQRLDPAAGRRLAELFPGRKPLLTDAAAAFDESTIRRSGATIERNPDDPNVDQPSILELSLSRDQMESLRQEVAIEVGFDTRWQVAKVISIRLPTGEDTGIVFSLSSLPIRVLEDIEKDAGNLDGAPTIGMQAEAGESLSLQVSEIRSSSMGSSILAERDISNIEDGPLRMHAARLRNELFLSLNDMGSVRFVLIEPVSGGSEFQVALDWPPGLGVTDLQLYSFSRTQIPDEFDDADAAYLIADFEVALEQYRRVSAEFDNVDDLRREALVKQALCLANLGPDRVSPLEEVCDRLLSDRSATPGESEWWRAAAAACRMDAVLDEDDSPEAIRGALEKLLSDCSTDEIPLDEVFAVIPLTERRSLFDQLARAWGFTDTHYMLAHVPSRSDKLSELLNLLPFVNYDPYERILFRWRLMDAYHLERNEIQATYEAGELLDDSQDLLAVHLIEPEEVVAILRDYIWLRIQSDAHRDALDRIDEVAEWFPDSAVAQALLEFERCRVHAAFNDWSEAQDSIERFFEGWESGQYQKPDFAYCDFGEACLLRGWAAEQAGAPHEDVVGYWMEGRYENRGRDRPQPSPLQNRITGKQLRDRTRSNTIASALSCLTQEVTDSELDAIVEDLILDASTDGPVYRITRDYLDRWFPTPYLRQLVLEIYRSPRGQEILRDRILGRLNFYDYHAMPTAWMITTGIKVELPAADFPPELEAKTEAALLRVLQLFSNGDVVEQEVVNLMAAWSGVDQPPRGYGNRQRPTGWRGTKTMLERLREEQLIDDEVPALCAYLVGRREHIRATVVDKSYEGDWSLEHARELLSYSVENAPSSSIVRDLAAQYLAEVENQLMQ